MGHCNDIPRGSDEQLAAMAQCGSVEAFEFLVERYDSRVRNHLRHVVFHNDIVSDLVQETFLATLNGLHRYDPLRPFGPWLFGVASNVARRALRDMTPGLQTSLGEISGEILHTGLSDFEDEACERYTIERVLESLSNEMREALLLTRLAGLSMREVSLKQGVSETAMRQRVHRAELAFKRTYKKFNDQT